MQILKNTHTKDIYFIVILSMLRIKISIPIMDSVVICNFTIISDKPSLRFLFPKLHSKTFRSPNFCRIPSEWFFRGFPVLARTARFHESCRIPGYSGSVIFLCQDALRIIAKAHALYINTPLKLRYHSLIAGIE